MILLQIKILCGRYFSCSKVFCTIVRFTIVYYRTFFRDWLRQPIRLSTICQDLNTGLDLHRITSGFRGAFATGVAGQQGTLTLPETWIRPPFGNLLMLQFMRPVLPNLPFLFLDFFTMNTPRYFLDLAHFLSESA